MIDARTEVLINAAIDGELSAQEQDELEAQLAGDPEARVHFERLQRVHGLLSALPEAPVSDALHARITDAVELPPAPHVGRPAAPAWSAVTRYGLAAGLGLALGVALVMLGPRVNDLDAGRMSGTLAPAPGTSSIDVRHALVTSRVSLERGGDFDRLRVELDSDVPIDLAIDLDGTGLRFAGLAPAHDPRDSMRVDRHLIRLRSEGRRRYELFLARGEGDSATPGAVVRLEYVHDGNSIERRALKAE